MMETKEIILDKIEKVANDCFGKQDNFNVTVEPNVYFQVIIEFGDFAYFSFHALKRFYNETKEQNLISYKFDFENSLSSFTIKNGNTVTFDFLINYIFATE